MEGEQATAEALAVESLVRRFERESVDLRFLDEPFLEAAELGDADSLRKRLASLSSEEKRALVRAVDQQGCSGLLLAARRADASLVDVLLQAGANPNDADSSGATALHYAAMRGSEQTLRLLLHGRAEATKVDDRGDTALMWAAGRRAVAVLLEAGADSSARNVDGRTALMLASSRGDADAVEALAAVAGADLDATDNGGRSAHEAANNAGYPEVAELLERLGAKASVVRAAPVLKPKESLLEAARTGDAAALRALLMGESGHDFHLEEEVGGDTPLLLASNAGSLDAVEVLLGARADANHADPFLRETPLMRAVLGGGNTAVLAALLEGRADPAARDLIGRTAADVAVAWGNTSGAELLQKAVDARTT